MGPDLGLTEAHKQSSHDGNTVWMVVEKAELQAGRGCLTRLVDAVQVIAWSSNVGSADVLHVWVDGQLFPHWYFGDLWVSPQSTSSSKSE